MTTDREAISTWTRHDQCDDPGRHDGAPTRYRCISCDWRGKGSMARAAHWRDSGHVVLDADDPRFKPYAVYCFDWNLDGRTPMRMYRVVGGDYDRSTLTEQTVLELGLPVRSK